MEHPSDFISITTDKNADQSTVEIWQDCTRRVSIRCSDTSDAQILFTLLSKPGITIAQNETP